MSTPFFINIIAMNGNVVMLSVIIAQIAWYVVREKRKVDCIGVGNGDYCNHSN